MKRSDHCEEIRVKALISKNNSTSENAVSQTLYMEVDQNALRDGLLALFI